MLHFLLRLAVFGAAIALGGCGANTNLDPGLQAVAFVPARPDTGKPYVLRANDQVRIQVYNEPTISGDYQIDATGSISVPLAGRIKAAGLTPVQLEHTIVARLDSGMLKNAHVNVQVSSYGPFYIYGEVKRAGEFPYKPGLTISDAVALAGGYTYRADETKAYVRAGTATREVVRPLDADTAVFPGDNIRIPERWF